MNRARLIRQVLSACVLAVGVSVICYPQNDLNQNPALTGEVKGTIILGDGTPCVHCTVVAFMAGGGDILRIGVVSRTTTDDKGGYLLDVFIFNSAYQIAFKHPVTHQWLASLTWFRKGLPGVYNFDLSRAVHAKETHGVVGTARFSNGSPCSKCAVLIRPLEHTYGVYTDSQGQFRYLNLEPGVYEFTVLRPEGGEQRTLYYVGHSQPATVNLKLLRQDGVPVDVRAVDNDPGSSDRVVYELSSAIGKQLTEAPSIPQAQGEPTEAQAASAAINQILGQQHGTLPAAQAVGVTNGGETLTTITNRTAYVLHVYFSGPSGHVVDIAAGGASQLSLAPGRYQVGARVSGPGVLPFYGVGDYGAGTRYSEEFYIGE
jgi:hypothetical protein